MKRFGKDYVIVHAPVGVNVTIDSSRKGDTKKKREVGPKPKHNYVRGKYQHYNSHNRQGKRLLCEIVHVGKGERVKHLKNPRSVNPECECKWTKEYKKMNMNKLLYYSENNSFDELFSGCSHVRPHALFIFKCHFKNENGQECNFCSHWAQPLISLRSNLKSHLLNVHHFKLPDGRSFRYKKKELRENN